MASDSICIVLRPLPAALPRSLSASLRLFAFGGLLIFSFVPIPIFINVSQIFLLVLCALALGCYLVRFEADIFAALSLVFLIGLSQAIGISHFASAGKNYLTPFLFITSLLIAPAMMIVARSRLFASRDRIVPCVINGVLVFLVIECVSRLIFSPRMGVTPETDISDSFYRYKFSLFFVDSNFVGIEILCLLAIMFAYREAIGRKRWLLIYFLLFATFSRASIAAGICQLVVYKLWRWRVWTFIGLLAAQAIMICKLFIDYTTKGPEAMQSIDGSLSSKFYILSLMATSYGQADTLQKLFGIGVGDSVNLISIFAHNIVVTLVLEMGIGGSMLFVLYVWALSRRCPVSVYLLILPVAINGFSLVSTSMAYFFATLGLLGALCGTPRDGTGTARNKTSSSKLAKG